jgi:hypothetical protein
MTRLESGEMRKIEGGADGLLCGAGLVTAVLGFGSGNLGLGFGGLALMNYAC